MRIIAAFKHRHERRTVIPPGAPLVSDPVDLTKRKADKVANVPSSSISIKRL
jgi:hypothetical protein